METNPFQSPLPAENLRNHETTSQAVGGGQAGGGTLSSGGILILLAAALFNCYAFDHAIQESIIPPRVHLIVRVVNLVGIVTVTVLCWFLLVPVLEGLARLVRHLSGRRSEVAAWNAAIYRSLQPAFYLAIPGAIVWGIWVYGFYFARFDFLTLSYAVGIPAHLLAATLYLPLIIRWYLLARPSSSDQPNGATS